MVMVPAAGSLEKRQPRLAAFGTLRPTVNPYVVSLRELEAKGFFTPEDKAQALKGTWRKKAFGAAKDTALDLEIGTGNGGFFLHRATQHPTRLTLGIERKLKPLAQSARRAQLVQSLAHNTQGSKNAHMLRFDARFLDRIFAPQELNDVFIYFPDPWPKRRHKKHQLLDAGFFKSLWPLQRPNSSICIKTDSADYFASMLHAAKASPYKVTHISHDWHKDPLSRRDFLTHFETIFKNQNLPICRVNLER